MPGEEKARRPVGWRSWAIEIGRQIAALGVRRQDAKLSSRRISGQHLGAIKTTEVGAVKGLAVPEDVVSRQVRAVAGGGPHPQFRIVIQVEAKRVGIQSVGAGGIVRLGYGDALGEGAGDANVADDPAIGQPIVVHDGIARPGGAVSAQRSKESREVGRTREQGTALVVDRQTNVHSLHDVVGADGEIDIGRSETLGSHAIEMKALGGRNERPVFLLQNRVRFGGADATARHHGNRQGPGGFHFFRGELVFNGQLRQRPRDGEGRGILDG